jgi:hypothetical protein
MGSAWKGRAWRGVMRVARRVGDTGDSARIASQFTSEMGGCRCRRQKKPVRTSPCSGILKDGLLGLRRCVLIRRTGG